MWSASGSARAVNPGAAAGREIGGGKYNNDNPPSRAEGRETDNECPATGATEGDIDMGALRPHFFGSACSSRKTTVPIR